MDAQDEIKQLREEVAELRKVLGERQQLDRPKFPPALVDNLEFITDLARYAEGLLSEAAVRKKYGFSEDTWTKLGTDDALVEAIELEKTRRIRSGAAKREKAQEHIVKAPDVLNEIMSDPKANAKHRIDSAKALDDLAGFAPQRPAAEEDRVIISINLGADTKLTFDKTVRPLSSDEAKKLIEHESRPRGVPGFEVD